MPHNGRSGVVATLLDKRIAGANERERQPGLGSLPGRLPEATRKTVM